MAQPAIKGRVPLPSFLAPDANMTTDANQTETYHPDQTDDPALPDHSVTDKPAQVQDVSQQQVFPNADMGHLSETDDHAATIQSQINRLDMERLKVAAQLVNTFNHAIQVQASRNDWNEHDYAAFIVALRSIDRIGYDAQQNIKK